MSNNSGRTAPVLLLLLMGIAVGAINILLYIDAVHSLAPAAVPGTFLQAIQEVYTLQPLRFLYFACIPFAAALIVALALALSGREQAPAAAPSASESQQAPARKPPDDSMLRFLAILQKEGRFIDFLQEDLAPYDDAQVGAAVRPIHEGCRQALHERVTIERIYDREEGSAVDIEPGFDSGAIRLTGNVQGEPPFRGTLQHSGWRATRVDLPTVSAEVDPHVLAPAEIEIE